MSSDVQIFAVLCCVETTTESDDLRLLCTKFNMLSLGFCHHKSTPSEKRAENSYLREILQNIFV